MRELKQSGKIKLIQVTKSVDWLVGNTSVDEFNPISFDGYQRTINEEHCKKIVNYLESEFFLPGSIICSTNEDYTEDVELKIVDGQHRIEAFKILSKNNSNRYEEIKNYTLSVIVLEKPKYVDEISTFITINKTSRKVDTSLAYVLRNKLRHGLEQQQTNLDKREYISVEVAMLINNTIDSKWYNKIMFEGPRSKNSKELISLNSFVKSTRSLVLTLSKNEIISLDWKDLESVENTKAVVKNIIEELWNIIFEKFSDCFEIPLRNKVIQGPIGYNSITRFIIQNINELNGITYEQLQLEIPRWIEAIDINPNKWAPGNYYSKFSSESGYRIIVDDLIQSMKKL